MMVNLSKQSQDAMNTSFPEITGFVYIIHFAT